MAGRKAPKDQNPENLGLNYTLAKQYLQERKEDPTWRWGSRMLRDGGWHYNPCVLYRTGWEDYYMTLPYDYDIKNDPDFNLHRSTYIRLGDLGFKWPEPTSREMLRTGHCGPDKNSLTRPAFLRFPENDNRPEPAYRQHLTDRTALHHLRADPLEGVIPFGRQCDMSNAKSVSHRDFKWRKRCCAVKPEERPPTYERIAHRFVKTDLHGDYGMLIDKVVKFQDDGLVDNFKNQELVKLKKAYYWPVNPITEEPLGGRLYYYPEDPCLRQRQEVCPTGEKDVLDKCNPIVIPDCKCEVLAHGPKKKQWYGDNLHYDSTHCLDPCKDAPCCNEEIPYQFEDNTPADCCFCKAETKGPPEDESLVCPPKPPCPKFPHTPCWK